ncbi:hypothetical protein [Flavobacterium psychrotrophum]|uniref:hypothetical protein n=1 Tax=Flavobacterium psychrotrophum TaxID=2294119 RepID=UPI0013C4ECAA|nr:hypothetical protein [Flavobacterium psychrotrophum]
MKYSIIICFAILCILCSSCRDAYTNSDITIEETKHSNFVRALENGGTFRYFTVVEVKNLISGETKEICTKGNFVAGALHIEFKTKDKQVYESKKRAKSRYFEFRNKEALDNISFFDYDPKLVEVVKKKYDFKKALKIIKEGGKFSIGLNDEEMKALAHALYNEGYLSGENSCFGGC